MQAGSRAIKLAQAIVGDVQTPSQINVLEIARSFVDSVSWFDFSEVDGVLVRLNGKSHIGVRKNAPFVRKRFTIAHELGHFLMHEGTFIDQTDISLNKTETEANCFASGLLMPETIIRKTYDQLANFVPKTEICMEMAWIFRVSRKAMEVRFLELGFITENNISITDR